MLQVIIFVTLICSYLDETLKFWKVASEGGFCILIFFKFAFGELACASIATFVIYWATSGAMSFFVHMTDLGGLKQSS